MRITLPSIVSLGLYWMHRTWKQCRDHTVEMASETGATHHPVWHGLGQPVPVYGWFRYHAHIRQYKALMVERGVCQGRRQNVPLGCRRSGKMSA